MKLTMQIFREHLREFHPQADIKSNRFAIEAVRLFAPDVALQPNTLYVGRLRDLFVSGSQKVICTHDNDMLLLETTDLESVLNCILNTLAFYTSWGSTMLELLASGAMLQDLFDASREALPAPVFLLDAAQRRLAHHPGYGIGEVDEFWDAIVQDGSSSLEFLIAFNRQENKRATTRGLYAYDAGVFPHDAWHYSFFRQDDLLGSASMIALDAPLPQGTLDVFLLFCQFLDRWFQSHIQEQQLLILDNWLRSAITEPGCDLSELRRCLRLRGWQEEDALLLFRLDAPLQPFSINAHVCRSLKAAFPDCLAIVTELSVCMLCNTAKDSEAHIRKTLRELLRGSRYYAAVSRPFTIHTSLYEHYRYLSTVCALCGKEIGEIYEGKDFTLACLLAQMREHLPPEALHPAVQLLADYDARHHTDFSETLYHYLRSGGSLVATMQALGIPRNTLLYRLRRLRELTGSDLRDPDERLHLWLTFALRRSVS